MKPRLCHSQSRSTFHDALTSHSRKEMNILPGIVYDDNILWIVLPSAVAQTSNSFLLGEYPDLLKVKEKRGKKEGKGKVREKERVFVKNSTETPTQN